MEESQELAESEGRSEILLFFEVKDNLYFCYETQSISVIMKINLSLLALIIARKKNGRKEKS